MPRKDILDRAYGHIPKNPVINFELTWISLPQGLVAYWTKFVRFFN